MAYLFEVQNKTVIPTTETLLTEPYKTIWERDKTEKKEIAIKEFSYVEFITSMKKSNPYRQYPEEKKHEVLFEALNFDKKWKPDKYIEQAIEKLRQLQKKGSSTYSYYMAAKSAAEKMKDFFEQVDLNERNFKTGLPIYKPKDLTSALNDTEKVLGNLKALEKKVEEELYDDSKTRSQKVIGYFANPESLNG
jgi:hypothetical protein